MINELERLKQYDSDAGFLDIPLHQNAKRDFKYLCSETGYTTLNNLNFQTVKTADSKQKYIGEFLVLGYVDGDGTLLFPQNLISIEDPNQYVAVVGYKDDKVVEVLVFEATKFKTAGLLSIFKNFKKTNEYGIKIGNITNEKLKQYSFGYVLKKLN